MKVVTPDLVKGKKIILRYDLDVAFHPLEEFKLKAGLPTLNLCLEHGRSVIMMGHVGRPDGKVVEQLKVAPIVEWFEHQEYSKDLESGKLQILENLRFDSREEAGDLEYAEKLASKGDFYVNEAFSSYRLAVSTTLLPKLLPHAAGLHFAEEVKKLTEIRNNPKKPFIAIMGGAKVEDKLPVIQVLAQKADAVLIGGKLAYEIRQQNLTLPKNVLVGKLNEDGFDLAAETVSAWSNIISKAAQIIWNGPLGKFEDPKYNQTEKVIKMILDSNAEIIIGGGDSVAALSKAGLLEEAQNKAFVSVGGGAMLKFLTEGTLPTIEVLS